MEEDSSDAVQVSDTTMLSWKANDYKKKGKNADNADLADGRRCGNKRIRFSLPNPRHPSSVSKIINQNSL